MNKIVLIDNFDSFTINFEQLLATHNGQPPDIISYTDLNRTKFDDYDLAVISPGPGHPGDYPDYAQLIDSGMPILGICLGMQIINDHLGGETKPSIECVHGRADTIDFEGRKVSVARYHSLYISRLADEMELIAQSTSGLPMAIRHKSKPLLGYQFHPESFLTENGEYFLDYAFQSMASHKL